MSMYIGNKITKLIKINDSARKTANNSKSISFTSLRKVSSKVYIGKLYNMNNIYYYTKMRLLYTRL